MVMLVTGCGAVPEGAEEEALAAEEAAISEGAVTHRNPTAMRLRLSDKVNDGGGTCTGLALNRRWILTSAHCVAIDQNGKHEPDAIKVQYTNQDDELKYVYGKSDNYYGATIHRHPDWDDGPSKVDIALIMLESELKVTATDMAMSGTYLDWDDTPVWDLDSDAWPFFSVAGYGRGSNPGSGIGCDDDGTTSGTKRIGDFEISRVDDDRYNQSLLVVVKTSSDEDLCSGDSGAPYFLSRGPGGVPFNFALHKGTVDDEVTGFELGVLIRPKCEVVDSTTVALSCPIREESRFFTRHRLCAW
jgi:hypothetical protein